MLHTVRKFSPDHMLTIALISVLLPFIFTSPQNLKSEPKDSIQIYVIKHSWHADIILPVHSMPTDSFPILNEFPDSRYLEIGWGDSAYYSNPDPGSGITVKAAIFPTPGILHITGINDNLDHRFQFYRVLQFTIQRNELWHLVQFISKEFVYTTNRRPIKIGQGIFHNSYFYRANSRYTVFKNCNTWTARALKQAGIPVSPFGALTVDMLFNRLSKYGAPVGNEG